MARSKTLIVYYSRSGTTRKLATAISEALQCETEEIYDRKSRHGIVGYGRSLIDALRRRPAAIVPAAHDPGAYDLVVIGTPVWAGTMSSPVRSYLTAHQARLKDAAFFCTLGGRGSETAFAHMQALAGKAPRACCAVTAREIGAGRYAPQVAQFVKEIEAQSSAETARAWEVRKDQPSGAPHAA